MWLNLALQEDREMSGFATWGYVVVVYTDLDRFVAISGDQA